MIASVCSLLKLAAGLTTSSCASKVTRAVRVVPVGSGRGWHEVFGGLAWLPVRPRNGVCMRGFVLADLAVPPVGLYQRVLGKRAGLGWRGCTRPDRASITPVRKFVGFWRLDAVSRRGERRPSLGWSAARRTTTCRSTCLTNDRPDRGTGGADSSGGLLPIVKFQLMFDRRVMCKALLETRQGCFQLHAPALPLLCPSRAPAVPSRALSCPRQSTSQTYALPFAYLRRSGWRPHRGGTRGFNREPATRPKPPRRG